MKKEKVNKKYSLIKEDFNSKTTWSKTKQANAIEQIVRTYPTAAQFKRAIMTSGDEKSKQLVKNMDENMSDDQYVDFLQYVFVKHSTIGKTLATALAGLGIGALTSYLLAKPAEDYGTAMGFKKATGVDVRGLSDNKVVRWLGSDKVFDQKRFDQSSVGKGLSTISPDLKQFSQDIGADKFANVVGQNGGQQLSQAASGANNGDYGSALNNVGQAVGRFINGKGDISNAAKDFVQNLPQKFGQAVGNLSDKAMMSDPQKGMAFWGRVGDAAGHFYNAANQYNDTKNLYKNAIQYGGGLAAGAAGAYGANTIQNWREKQQQNRINALKYRRYYS